MKKAMFWNIEKDSIRCRLCPNDCLISPNQRGLCRVRINKNNCLYTENYGILSAINIDPIEKKPFYHFLPGNKILSLGSIGCNLKCSFCQNWEISQCSINDFPQKKIISINEIINASKKFPENIGIAFTYNEPTIWYEFMFDIARKSKEYSLKNVMISNGYINKEPLLKLIPYIDAFSIDLKAFNKNFYKNITKGKFSPVLNSLKLIKENNKHLEIEFLLIPRLNDDLYLFKKMLNWIKNNLGIDTILHINRYYPAYKLNISPTSKKTLLEFFSTAEKILNYVYIGNINLDQGNNTYCSKCKNEVIIRNKYNIYLTGINSKGKCNYCGNKVIVNE